MSEKHSHTHDCGCCLSVGRRDFMTTVGLSALAIKSGMMGLASTTALAAQPGTNAKPRVRAVFVRPDVERYWMGWPGASYDIKARQADYTKLMAGAAKKLGVDLKVTAEPLSDRAAMDAFLKECKDAPPDGVIVSPMSLNAAWAETDRFVAERPADIPTIVFSPMGTSFTGHLQKTRNKPKTLVGATQDLNWLAEAVHLLKTIWDMKTTRICIINGTKTEDKQLAVIGTTLHYIPLQRWVDEFNQAEATDEMKALAAHLKKTAKKTVEPNAQDIFNSAKNYVVAKRIMAAENCNGISLNCLGLIGSRRIPCPPCMAWLTLNDEGGVGCCECDWNAAITLRLCASLCGRPGFMQDPCPNTINGTLMGAHCSSPTKLRGFDKESEPLILRNHSESALGVSPQVIWPIGEEATVASFSGPDKLILGTGRVVANIDTPPAGGCRTSVELAMDDVADPRDCKGFHQSFLLGNVAAQFKAYCHLAGITVVPIGATS